MVENLESHPDSQSYGSERVGSRHPTTILNAAREESLQGHPIGSAPACAMGNQQSKLNQLDQVTGGRDSVRSRHGAVVAVAERSLFFLDHHLDVTQFLEWFLKELLQATHSERFLVLLTETP